MGGLESPPIFCAIFVRELKRCVSRAGQSFRLACLSGKNPGGENPRLLRDRPADGSLCPGGRVADSCGVAVYRMRGAAQRAAPLILLLL